MMTFHKRVLEVVRRIPVGRVMTYAEVALRAGNPKAVRAVGNAMRRNDDWPNIPCHRVVRSDGRIGFWNGKGGMRKKAELLKREGHAIKNFRIYRE